MPENFNAAPSSTEQDNTATGWENITDVAPAAEAAPTTDAQVEAAPATEAQNEITAAQPETTVNAQDTATPAETLAANQPTAEAPTNLGAAPITESAPTDAPKIPQPLGVETTPSNDTNAESLKPVELAAPTVAAPKALDIDAFVAGVENSSGTEEVVAGTAEAVTEPAPQAEPAAEAAPQTEPTTAVTSDETIPTPDLTPAESTVKDETEVVAEANPRAEATAQSTRNEAVADGANDTIITSETTNETSAA